MGSAVGHPFAEQKSRRGLFVRTLGIARAKAKIGLANIAFNMKRLVFLGRIDPHARPPAGVIAPLESAARPPSET